MSSGRNLFADEIKNLGQLFRRAHKSFYRAATTGQFINHRNIQVAVKRQAERARNRRRRHHQQMWIISFADQRFALRHAKLVLLINDDQTEHRQIKSRREQRVRANRQ